MRADIAVATVSWIRTAKEAGLILKTIEALSQLELPVVIVDGGSDPRYLQKIREMKNVVLLTGGKGLTAQLIESQRLAAKLAKTIFYLHTDKLDFALETAPKMIEYYRSLKHQGVLVPTRTPASMATYPIFQQKVEDFLNYFMSDYLGVTADYYAGPKIYPASLVSYLDQLQGEIGWGFEAYFYALAKRLEMPFDFLSFYMNSPVDIDDKEETKKYRLKVTQWQIDGLAQGQKATL